MNNKNFSLSLQVHVAEALCFLGQQFQLFIPLGSGFYKSHINWIVNELNFKWILLFELCLVFFFLFVFFFAFSNVCWPRPLCMHHSCFKSRYLSVTSSFTVASPPLQASGDEFYQEKHNFCLQKDWCDPFLLSSSMWKAVTLWQSTT